MRWASPPESVVALCKGRCELAGFHIPEGALGREILRKYEPWLKPRAQRVIYFVGRHQGMLVPPGNPLGIKTIKDIATKKARFSNRQRSSCTRVAFERVRQNQGVDRAEIGGY